MKWKGIYMCRRVINKTDQKILKHNIVVTENNNNICKSHVFCEVHWYVQQSHKGHYGSAAILCMLIT